RRDDSRLSGRDSSRNSSRKEPKAVLNPSEQQERAFLVGVEFRTKGRAGRTGKSSATITPGAQAARDHATSVAASSSSLSLSSSSSSSSSSSLPTDSPDFSSEESL